MKLIKLSLSEIFNAPKFALFFLLNISVGLSGLILLENFKEVFNQSLQERSKNLLGADFSISGRKEVPLELKEKIQKLTKSSSALVTKNLFSMATRKNKSRLVYIKEQQDDLPFYGGLRFKDSTSNKENKLETFDVWIYPEIAIYFGVEIGDKLKIGSRYFTVKKIVEKDSGQTFQMGSLAPRIFMSGEGMRSAKLIQKGSTVWNEVFFKTRMEIDTDKIAFLNKIINDSSLRVNTPKNTSQQVGRVLNYLTDFLGLVSLVSLFLALVGIFYLYRSYLASKRTVFAIYKSLGILNEQIVVIQFGSLLILGTFGILGAIGLSSLAMPLASKLLNSFLKTQVQFSSDPSVMMGGFLIGIISILLVGLPLVIRSLRNNPASLFQDGVEKMELVDKKSVLLFIPLVLYFVFLSIWLSHSVKVGLAFIGVFLFLLLTIFPFLLWLFGKLEKSFSPKNLLLRLSVKYMTGHKLSTISIIISLFFGAMLINFIPQLQKNLQSELKGGDGRASSLFLFDIQPEQVGPLKDFIASTDQKLTGLSPMIRGRLAKVNDKPFQVKAKKAVTREGQRSQRFRNRGISLTYKNEYTEDEKIISGDPSLDERDGQPGISLEYRYARRLGLKIGDKIEFDIMGVPFSGVVRNLRRVRWTSFSPNFFISFGEGVLENAPQTFLASIDSFSEFDKKTKFQAMLSERFSNVSAVDIDRLVEKIQAILNQMSLALKMMGALAVFVGLLVVFALVNHQMTVRKKDLVLLKVLGLDLPRVRKLIIGEFTFLSFASTSAGVLAGIGLAYGFSTYLFEGLWVFEYQTPLMTLGLMGVISFVVTYFASSRTLKEKPAPFLS